MKYTVCVLGLIALLPLWGDVDSCTRIIDLGTTKAVPFDETVSPDGAYAIGWTAFTKRKDAAPIDWSKWNSSNIEDFFVANGSIETDGDYYGMTDGLIDIKNRAFLPLASEDPEWPRKNLGYLFAVWGPVAHGVRYALVENDSHWFTENFWLVTIDAQGMHALDLADRLTKAVGPILRAKRPICTGYYETFFHDFVGVSGLSFGGSTATVPFNSDIPKSLIETSRVKGTITFRLSDGGVVNVSSKTAAEDPFADNPELGKADRNLNVVYAELVKMLAAPQREALKKEQLEWIARRDQAAELAMTTWDGDQPLDPAGTRNKALLHMTYARTVELKERLGK